MFPPLPKGKVTLTPKGRDVAVSKEYFCKLNTLVFMEDSPCLNFLFEDHDL